MIRVEGAKELRAALRKASATLPKQVGTANKRAAMIVVAAALPSVPVRSGRLRKSVRALGSQKAGVVKAGTAKVDYAAAIHWGRKRGNVWHHRMGRNPIKGRPFLWDAAKAKQREVVAAYAREIEQLLDKVRAR